MRWFGEKSAICSAIRVVAGQPWTKTSAGSPVPVSRYGDLRRCSIDCMVSVARHPPARACLPFVFADSELFKLIPRLVLTDKRRARRMAHGVSEKQYGGPG